MGEAGLEDLYRTLQVAPHADLDAIRAAYRRLARLYHPDRNPLPEAAVRMRAINAAYAVLSDPGRRASYDARRYLPQTGVATRRPSTAVYARQAPVRRPVVMVSQPPTPLQRRVDRIVAVLGVLLLVGIGFYAVSVIPSAEKQFQAERARASSPTQAYRPVAPEAVATAQTAAREPGQAHATAAAGVPDRLRQDVGLRSFPGTVLIAPATLEPFRNLPILRLDATGQGIARYAVYYGDLTTGGATISGLVGRAAFDAAPPHLADCAPDATYCVGSLTPQSSPAPPGLELFRPANLVEDFPAFVVHRVCCNGVFWSLSWYEPRANMSYTIDLSRNVAALYGSPNADDDLAAARAVAALADQLVRLP